MSDRKQLVCNNGHFSSTILDIENGAPQGSILGPLLFLIYINDLPSCLKHSTPVFYADDSNLLISDTNCETLIRKGNEDLANVQNWLISNKLALNVGKTQAIIFRTPNTKIPTNLSKLMLGVNQIKLVESTEFLGVTITKSLSWKPHMMFIKSKIRRTLGACRKIRSQIGQGASLKLYHSLIESHILYAITTWCFGNSTMQNSLQRTCDKFLKSTFSVYDPQTLREIMRTKGVMTIDQLLFFEIGKCMYKIHTATFPVCFQDYFTPITHTMTTRSRRIYNSETPRIQLTKQALDFKGGIVWRLIPNHVKYENNDLRHQYRSFNSFKIQLKQFIIECGSDDIADFVMQIRYSMS